MPEERVPDEAMRRVALALVEHCVRNTRLEDIHAGTGRTASAAISAM